MRQRVSILTIIHITLATGIPPEITISVPFDLAGLQITLVSQCKNEAIHSFQKKIATEYPNYKSRNDIIRDIMVKDSDSFVFAIVDVLRDIWLRNEHKSLQSYLDLRIEPSHHPVKMSLRLIKNIPEATLRISILSTQNKISDLSQKIYTTYTIQVGYNDMQWEVSRRFKEFNNLHETLIKKLQHSKSLHYLPTLPPKKAITPKNGVFVLRRQLQLEEYLKDLVCLPGMMEDVDVLVFIGVVSTYLNKEINPESRSVVHISALHKCLNFGDIVLFNTKFNASVVQRTITGSRYDHVGIVVPGTTPQTLGILESTGEGIQVYSLKSRLLAYSREVSNIIVARRFVTKRTRDLVSIMEDCVLQLEGNAYSIFGILNTREQTHRENEQLKDKYFCSELVAAILIKLGWIQTTLPPGYFWPGSFANGNEIEHYLAPHVTFEPEIAIDCKLMEVGRAVKESEIDIIS